METWIDEGAAVLRRLFGLAQIYKYSGAARDDFAANNAKASLSELPRLPALKLNELKAHSLNTVTDLLPGELIS